MNSVLEALGLHGTPSGVFAGEWKSGGAELASVNPATGATLLPVRAASPADVDPVVARAAEAFQAFRLIPAPRRGIIHNRGWNARR